MVNDAAMDRFCTEKALKEARLQIEGLQAEVSALKTLVLTSTPSNPNLSHHHGTSSPSKCDIFGSSFFFFSFYPGVDLIYITYRR